MRLDSLRRCVVLLLLPAAAGAPFRAEAAGRRAAGLRAPVLSRTDVAVQDAPTLRELARRWEAVRIQREFGDDWDEILVETTDGDITAVVRRHGGTVRGHGLGRDAVKAPQGKRHLDWYLELWEDPSVARLEPNPRATHPACRQMSIDILESGAGLSGGLSTQPALAMTSPCLLDATGVTVAVVDSGVAPLPSLEPFLLPALDMLNPRGPAVVTDPADLASMALDANGHGTAMASLVAAVAEGVRIQPVRVVGSDCDGTAFDLAAGLVAAADGGASVALVSLSTPHDSPTLRRAVEEVTARGMLVVAAAGNAGALEFPAAYPGVVAVTAGGADGWPPAFAPTGVGVDLAAPGVGVVAEGPEQFLSITGTSPSAALVAGAAARIVHVLGDLQPPDWLAALRWATRPAGDIAPSLEGSLGAGLLDFDDLK